MSHQERTWVETTDQETGLPRWDVLINGTPVPGGYIVQTASDNFEVHYPRIATFSKPTLAEAKERVEWAPPITRGVANIGNETTEDECGFESADEAAQELGVSVWRVNAMIANGKIAARRRADGTPEVSRSSVRSLLAQQNS